MKIRERLRKLRERIKAALYGWRHGESLFLDPLTKVFDRRLFEDGVYSGMVFESQRDDQPICVVIFDIDGFKQINDQLGHPEGDKVLQKVARLVECMKRRSDILIRYGGDEFLFIFPKTKISGARELITKIAIELAQNLNLSITAGFSDWVPGKIKVSLEALIKMADEHLLEQKKVKGISRG